MYVCRDYYFCPGGFGDIFVGEAGDIDMLESEGDKAGDLGPELAGEGAEAGEL